MKKRTRTRKPTSVGEILSEEFLIPLELTQKAFAEHLGLDVKTINRLVNGKTSVTPPLALKMASALGTTPEFWMNLQVANDLWELKNMKINLPKQISA
ncbi:addiction module antidote protein HigA [Bacteriovorax sp. BAL6_X]|uniref:HigA family addiction module antitoxin n=1 Tax=Bacteriovorax sp. BAL6_X TaxID=1201290 RepID=UPI000385CB8B|nr:HigA family addiction module antitoxin [Bacteriovorax sp. BAL6_X]EPZ52201.1 addiction module antidote protein HigA [Bacteriovorax sp. BAL6_X]